MKINGRKKKRIKKKNGEKKKKEKRQLVAVASEDLRGDKKTYLRLGCLGWPVTSTNPGSRDVSRIVNDVGPNRINIYNDVNGTFYLEGAKCKRTERRKEKTLKTKVKKCIIFSQRDRSLLIHTIPYIHVKIYEWILCSVVLFVQLRFYLRTST